MRGLFSVMRRGGRGELERIQLPGDVEEADTIRYDSTGRTDEIKFDEVSWDDYFSDLFEGVDRKILDDDRKKYQGESPNPLHPALY